MNRRLPPGMNWIDALYQPKKVARLRARLRRKELEQEGPGFTKKQFNALVKKFDGRCVACGEKGLPLVPDHIEPLSKGGEHHIRNIQPLCRQCNLAKGITCHDYRPEDVRQWLRELRGRCKFGSAFKDPARQCKNLARWGSEFCRVHSLNEDEV